MKDGMILDNPTIFGMMNGKLLGAGEAGSETVVGTSRLMEMIGDAVDDGLTSFGSRASRPDTLLPGELRSSGFFIAGVYSAESVAYSFAGPVK